MKLKIKEVLAQILNWISTQGASSVGKINYGTATSITPTRSGWLVVTGKTTSAQSVAPVMRIFQGGNIIAESTGLTASGTTLAATCYARKGTTYTVTAYRSTVSNVTLY